jgi:hypothetical protein
MSVQRTFVDRLRSDLLEGAVRLHRRRRRWRLLGVGAAVVAAALLGTALLARDDGDEQVRTADRPSPRAPTNPSPRANDALAVEWDVATTTLPGQSLPGLFWTGDHLLVVHTENGGADVAGELWDPRTDEARPIAPSGLNWRVGSAMAWTGSELLVIGGSNGPGLNRVGAAYDPATDRWRPLPDPPGGAGGEGLAIGEPAVWTGTELVLWRAALAYEPARESWRRLPASPLSQRVRAVTVWTGREVVVWGGCWTGAQCDETNSGLFVDGAAYDPALDSWRPLPAGPLTPAVHAVGVWDGNRVLITVTDPDPALPGARTAAWSPATGAWSVLPDPPLAGRRYAAGVWTGTRFVVWGGGSPTYTADGDADEGAAFDARTGRWSRLSPSPGPGRLLHAMAAAGDWVYISSTLRASPPLVARLPP